MTQEQLPLGTPLGPETTTALAADLSYALGIPARDIVVIPHAGWPPIPVPPAAAPDGTGRVPSGARPEVVEHPVFWLPDDVLTQRPNETDIQWAIRMTLELANLEYYDFDTRSWEGAMVRAGIDISEAAMRSRTEAYVAGLADPFFCKFQILPGSPPTEDDGDNWAENAAVEVDAHLSRMWDDGVESIANESDLEAAAAIRGLDTATFATDSEVLVTFGQALQEDAAAGTGSPDAVLDFRTAVVAVLTRIIELHEDSAIITDAVLDFEGSREAERFLAAEQERIQSLAHEMYAKAFAAVESVERQPWSDDPYAELFQSLSQMYSDALRSAKQAAATVPYSLSIYLRNLLESQETNNA